MVNPNLTHRPFWLDLNGNPIPVAFTPINQNAAFSVPTFKQEYDRVEALKDADKAQYSQLIFGNDVLESASDRDFNTFKKNFNGLYVQEDFNTYVARKSPELIRALNAKDPEQTERFLLNKNRNAKTAAFRIAITPATPQNQIPIVQAYNGVVSAKEAYHTELETMETQGDTNYVTGRLANITPMQMAVILSATGSQPGDFTRIAKSYRDFHASKFLEKAKAFGIEQYVGNNLMQAKTQETGHRAALKGLETVVEGQIAALGPGATADERKAVYRTAEAQKTALATAYQNAESDAKYLFSDLAGKVYEKA